MKGGHGIPRQSARCSVCNYKQNVRRDGTFGKHHIWIGDVYQGVCAGTGRTPDEAKAVHAQDVRSWVERAFSDA